MLQPKEHPQQFVERKITALPLPDRARSQGVRERLAAMHYDAKGVVNENADILSLLDQTRFGVIAQKFVKGEELGFEEAFLGMTFAVAATNSGIFQEVKPRIEKAQGDRIKDQRELLGPGQTFLTAMAMREAHGTLTATEVAGMVAAAMMDINARFGHEKYILETGGMGGDKGFVINGEKRKIINASTLSAIVLSAIDIPVIKHGSYANTSQVGSTDAIESLDVNIYQDTSQQIGEMLTRANFYFSDAHIAKTIHDLSHSPYMRHETINHIIGPMTPPVDKETKLNKIIGVNEGAHPGLIARAYEILHERRYQNVGNVVAISGLTKDFDEASVADIEDQSQMRQFMMLDEVSPYATLLGIVQNGRYVGSFIVRPEDFGVSINTDSILIQNVERKLLDANKDALSGINGSSGDYLALNAAIGLFCAEYLDREGAIGPEGLNKAYLQESFARCREAITSGRAGRHLKEVVALSNGEEVKEADKNIFDDVDVVIFDVDNTLVRPRVDGFYTKHSEAVNIAVAKRYNVSPEEGKRIADYYRMTVGGGERALFDGTAHLYFPELAVMKPDYAALYEEMSAIDPTGFFDQHDYVRVEILKLRQNGKKVVALTDSARVLSEKVLAQCGFNPETDFDLYLAYEANEGPRKMIRQQEIFDEISQYLQTLPERMISIGDTYSNDIVPAQLAGMKTCLVGTKEIEGYTGLRARTIYDIFAGELYET